MKKFIILQIFIVFTFNSCKQGPSFDVSKLTTEITTGNSWVINDVNKSSDIITKDGITNWQDTDDIIRTYFYTEKEATIPFGIIVKGTSDINVSYNNKTEFFKINSKLLDIAHSLASSLLRGC